MDFVIFEAPTKIFLASYVATYVAMHMHQWWPIQKYVPKITF